MFNDLRYSVVFPTNGVALSGQLSFQPGSTAISGANGIGKSFVAEMLRYGLFGKKALRGPASDYKTLDMGLAFSINEVEYTVARNRKKEELSIGDEVLAVGADAVNKKIIELLGFDLEVFDVVCAANQKESERLTKLTPARRKELIDEVVGLSTQESAERACRDEANGLRREAEAVSRTLVVPTKPTKPAGYRPSEKVKFDLEKTKALVDERAKLQRIIDAVGPEPVEPAEAPVDVEKLELHEQSRVANEAQRALLTRQLENTPAVTHSLAELDAADALALYDADIARRGPKPDYSLVDLDQWETIWDQKAHDTVTCPKCSHEFSAHADVDVAAIKALPDPPIGLKEIAEQLRRHSHWRDAPAEPEGVRLSAQERSEGRVALAKAGDRPRLEKELAELKTLADKSDELAEARRIDRLWDLHAHAAEQHMIAAAAADEAQAKLTKLAVPKHSAEALQQVYTDALVYEGQLVAYEAAAAHFDTVTAEVSAKQERSDAFMAGAKGLVEARRTLKAFLAPSLSRVASKLISEMTINSKRPLTAILVDEDMNISANGQDVSTFNGAHATMINLALRLALAQVLVARVFPVFIGDEIDSDADAANSQAIADALMACKSQLSQIILISHKQLEGTDHEVLL